MAKQKRHSLATAKKRAKFLTAYATVGTITHAARLANMDRKTHYRWMSDDRYAEAFAEAEDIASEELEREARRRAIEGVKEPVGFYKGEASEYVQRYSDTLLIFLLKGAKPDKYRERSEIEHRGKVSSTVIVETVDPHGVGGKT